MKKYCRNCKAEAPADAESCANCGCSDFYEAEPEACGASEGFAGQSAADQAPRSMPQNRKDFINNYADPSLRKEIKNYAILCYVCAGLSLVVAFFVNWAGILDALILLGLSLGMHLGRSKVCAILILVMGAASMIVNLIVAGKVAGWLILLAGIFAVKVFNKADKHYKAYLEGKAEYVHTTRQ